MLALKSINENLNILSNITLNQMLRFHCPLGLPYLVRGNVLKG